MKGKTQKLLCENCKTGEELYKLDSRDVMCPYMSCHKGDNCVYYEPIEKEEK